MFFFVKYVYSFITQINTRIFYISGYDCFKRLHKWLITHIYSFEKPRQIHLIFLRHQTSRAVIYVEIGIYVYKFVLSYSFWILHLSIRYVTVSGYELFFKVFSLVIDHF